jgi:hypothetical protein
MRRERLHRQLVERGAELLLRSGDVLRLVVDRPEREERHRPLRELVFEVLDESAGGAVPAAHVDAPTENDACVPVEIVHLRRGPHVGVEPALAEHGADRLRHLLRRAVLRRVRNQDRAHGSSFRRIRLHRRSAHGECHRWPR